MTNIILSLIVKVKRFSSQNKKKVRADFSGRTAQTNNTITTGGEKMSFLAINGGKKTVADGIVKPWPPIDQTDEAMVMKALRDRHWQAFGGNCSALEQEFAHWNGNRYCITTNSGTAALHMGLVACGVGAGDHVLVTAYSWSASATCILHHNAIPVFVDIDFATINMDVDKLEAAVTSRTKAVIVVHLHGLAVNMDKITAFARKHNLSIIEDACQSHGALFNGQKVGTFGDVAAFSFSQNKSLCSGEGGLFVTNDEEKLKRARQLWSFGETIVENRERDYHVYALGWMYRNNDIIAALGRSQLMKLDENLNIQKRNTLAFHEAVKHLGLKNLILPFEPEGHTHSWYEYVARLDMDKIGWTGDPEAFRTAVFLALRAEGVPVCIWQRYILPEMSLFQKRNAYGLGTPWSIDNAGEGVEYIPEEYPEARLHAKTHIGLNLPLRAPNTLETVKLLAEGYCKVFENLNQLDPERIDAEHCAR